MKKVISLFLFLLMVWNSSAKDFPKVILAGDYPDPSILRDGKDYYMTHSPFYYGTGLPDLALPGIWNIGNRYAVPWRNGKARPWHGFGEV